MNGPRENHQSFGSFRDPSGFVFSREGEIYRQVNYSYRENYRLLMDSGLYAHLAGRGMLVHHRETGMIGPAPEQCYKVIKPEEIPFVSYPYEWSFSQLKDAALLTLRTQKEALEFGMSLKDCSAYNVQFVGGTPVFIDSLSFEEYRDGRPWVAYRQFCQHFVAPLALAACLDFRLCHLLKTHLDGMPLDLVAKLLPARTRLSFSLLAHIHLHARAQAHYSDKAARPKRGHVSRLSLMGLVDNLCVTVEKLRWSVPGTEWGRYYEATNYTPAGFAHKKQVVAHFLDGAGRGTAWDLGANTGVFSRIAADTCRLVVSLDADPAAVEKNYLDCRANGDSNILPLLMDLTNPSPGAGWSNVERMSLLQRGPGDTVLALALVHHLALSHNLPLGEIAGFLGSLCRRLIIEFIPKEDSQVQRLLATRDDIFPDYSAPCFEKVFEGLFTTRERVRIRDSERTLYLMERNPS